MLTNLHVSSIVRTINSDDFIHNFCFMIHVFDV